MIISENQSISLTLNENANIRRPETVIIVGNDISMKTKEESHKDSLQDSSNDGYKNKNSSISNSERILTSLSAGAIAGSLAKTAIAPLDRTKIYYQTNPSKKYSVKGAIRFLLRTYYKDGFFSLWRGNSATMARIIPYASIQFMSHEQYKILLSVDIPGKETKPSHRFLAGSLAGMTGQALTYPLDRARAVLAVTRKCDYKDLRNVFLRIGREEGIISLYRGFSPTMMGVIPYAGTSFFTYETLKKYLSNPELAQSVSNPTPFKRLCSGAIAGLVGQSVIYPLDIVRRRMQTGCQTGYGANYQTIFGTLLYVYRTEGILKGWYKGLSMNFLKGPIAVGISFTTFDYIQMGLRYLLFIVNSDKK